MVKKDLKWYESPVMEVVELEVEAQILAGSGEDEPGEDEGQGGSDWF